MSLDLDLSTAAVMSRQNIVLRHTGLFAFDLDWLHDVPAYKPVLTGKSPSLLTHRRRASDACCRWMSFVRHVCV